MPAFLSNSIVFLSGLSAEWSPIGPRRGARLSPIGPGSGGQWSPIGPGWSPIGPGWSPIGPGWSPIGPGWSPIGPGSSPIGPGTSPIGPHRSKPKAAYDEAAAANPANAQGWEGIDPAWTYDSQESLQAQALRKSRAKTAHVSDGMAQDAFTPPPYGANARADKLWRWAPEFRMRAVSSELTGRVQVHGRSVWLFEPPNRRGVLVPAKLLYELPANLDNIDWQVQVDAVLRAAAEREDRLPEILSQASSLWAFFESICGISLDRAPAYAELVLAAEDWALKLLMLLKHNVGARRPVEVSSLVVPVIGTPGHGSLPSGHATLAAFNTELLRLMLYPDPASARAQALDRLARRIAFNRVVAGVHFPVDSQAGYALGHQLARVLVALVDPQHVKLRTRRARDVIRGKHRLQELPPGVAPTEESEPPAKQELVNPSLAPTLSALWKQAQIELQRQRI